METGNNVKIQNYWSVSPDRQPIQNGSVLIFDVVE